MNTVNHLGQPIGFAVPNWTPPSVPPREALIGRYCRVEPLDIERHAADLYAAYSTADDDRNWTYLADGPFDSLASYTEWLQRVSLVIDPLFHTVVDAQTDQAVGVAAYLRITPSAGSIEVGHINFSPLLQRTPAATEAIYLMMRRAFELGYRRFEWKCDALNAKSRVAAQRLGLSYEGVFRQALIYKGRNRDTAWYAAIDREWPELKTAFETWLDPANFDANGEQRTRLSDLTSGILKQRG